jgi:hypothetical protein
VEASWTTGDPVMSRLGDHRLDGALNESWPTDTGGYARPATPCMQRRADGAAASVPEVGATR